MPYQASFLASCAVSLSSEKLKVWETYIYPTLIYLWCNGFREVRIKRGFKPTFKGLFLFNDPKEDQTNKQLRGDLTKYDMIRHHPACEILAMMSLTDIETYIFFKECASN